MAESLLWDPFEGLAPFLDWALEPERARTEKKLAATMDQMLAFYGKMLPHIDAILNQLDDYLGEELPAPENAACG